MLGLYSRPLRVYVLLGALALWGIYSGLNLPISLFPQSSQVTIAANVPYGSYSAQQFFETYGYNLEFTLNTIKVDGVGVKEIRAEYGTTGANYKIDFEWGASSEQAVKDVETTIKTRFTAMSEDVRRGIWVYSYRQNQGFFAVSFFSPLRSLDEIYDLLNPIIRPLGSRIEDAESVGLYNPNAKELTVTLIPEKLAQYEISTEQVQLAIQSSVTSLTGGSLKIGDSNYQLDIPKSVTSREDLGKIQVSQDPKRPVYLRDIANLTVALSAESQQKFKTSGVESLILFASPKEGGNIKVMADQITEVLEKSKGQYPTDIEYRILVNPSEFINKSIDGVVKEVFLAAFLAVLVLLFFIGSFKNVVTAAIEIPLSLLLAFILMQLTGMNLNLISLGGLALSAGMNVDASVVVLENIFRHFKGKDPALSYQEKAKILVGAVKEVQLPILAATLASLVVFLPLVFTQGLTNSLLGDLAKAVIFSHGLSAVVALILVPTIRLQLLSRSSFSETHSYFEPSIKRFESFYGRTLERFLKSTRAQVIMVLAVIIGIPLLVMTVVPRLEKEVIGKPESDWLIVSLSSPLLTSLKQYEAETDILESSLMTRFGEKVLYTFTQMGTGYSSVMLRLRDRDDMKEMEKIAEEEFKSTATTFYNVEAWNPSELRIPDPPESRIEIVNGSAENRQIVAQDIQTLILSQGIYDQAQVTPSAGQQKGIVIRDYVEFGSQQSVLNKQKISHYLRVATDGLYVETMHSEKQSMPIYLRLEGAKEMGLEAINALPVGFEGRVLPLGALAKFSIEDRLPDIYRENQRDLTVIKSRLNKERKSEAAEQKKALIVSLNKWKNDRSKKSSGVDEPTVVEAVPDLELRQALDQLKWAIGLSILLIFLTMVIQLGDIVQALLVLVAIPLGFVGVMLSLWVFQSSLSLNSGLGTILLNGIAVANSIILVDFIHKLFAEGKSALHATIEAAQARLRPILMTSLTTVLGMLPIALGLGDGGKILQPLGIAVCGGLWVSMALTVFLVPALQYRYLNYKERSAEK